MSKSKHSEAQMIEALKQVEAGRSVEEVGRTYGTADLSKVTVRSFAGARVVGFPGAFLTGSAPVL